MQISAEPDNLTAVIGAPRTLNPGHLRVSWPGFRFAQSGLRTTATSSRSLIFLTRTHRPGRRLPWTERRRQKILRYLDHPFAVPIGSKQL